MVGSSNLHSPVKRALVVQPDLQIREHISSELSRRGFQVDACPSTREARVAFSFQPLVIASVERDLSPAEDLISWLRSNCPDEARSPYILAIGDHDLAEQATMDGSGWNEFLSKPLDWSGFLSRLEVIESWLAQKPSEPPVSPDSASTVPTEFGPAAPHSPTDEFQAMIDRTPRPMAVCDRNLRYLAVNLQWRKDFQLEDRNLIGLKHDDVFPYLGVHWERALQSVLRGSTEDCSRDLWVQANNRQCWVRWHLQPWTSAQGNIGGLTIACDLTDPEERLDPSQPPVDDRVTQIGRSLLYGSSGNPFLRLDLDGRIQECNQSSHAWTLHGQAPEPNSFFWEQFCPEDSREVFRLQFLNDAQQSREQGRFCFAPTWAQVFPPTHPMGPDAAWAAFPFLDSGGNVSGVLFFGMPIPKTPSTEAVPPEVGTSLAQLVDFAPFGLVLLDREGRTVFANHEQASLLGLDIRSHASVEDWLRSACADRNGVEELVADWKNSVWREEATRTYPLRSSDLRSRQIRFHPRHTSDGGMLLALTDVTEFHREMDLLKDTEARFRSLFQDTSVGLVLEDALGKVTEVNPAAESLLRVSRDHLLERNFQDLIHPEDQPAVQSRIAEIRSRPRASSSSLDVRLVPAATQELKSNSDAIQVRLTLSGIPDAEGRLLTLAYFLADVAIDRMSRTPENGDRRGESPFRPREKSLTDALRRHALTFEHSRDAIVITDYTGRITDWNSAATRLFGSNRESMIGRDLSAIFAPKDPASFNNEVADALAQSGSWSGRKSFTRADGSEGICEVRYAAAAASNGQPASIIGLNWEPPRREPSSQPIPPPSPAPGSSSPVTEPLEKELSLLVELASTQLRFSSSQKVRQALRVQEGRLLALARAHQLLASASPELPGLNLAEYFSGLCSQALQSHHLTTPPIDVRLHCPDLLFPLPFAVPLGLILTESLYGILDFACEHAKSGALIISVDLADSTLEIRIQGDGLEFPDRLLPIDGNDLSMEILRLLAIQVQATFAPLNSPQTGLAIRVPIAPTQPETPA